MLKLCKGSLSKILCNLINRSMEQENFPSVLKDVCITPVFKYSGDMSDPVNYRPIAITSNICISKIFEKVIVVRLLRFWNANNIISKNQYGFL